VSTLGITSFALGAVLYAVLAALLLPNWHKHELNRLLLASCVISAFWLGSMCSTPIERNALPLLPSVLELARVMAWCLFLTELIKRSTPPAYGHRLFGFVSVPMGLLAVGLALYASLFWHPQHSNQAILAWDILFLIGILSLAITALVLLEFLIRRTHDSSRRQLDLLFVALGAVFTYDIYFYSEALLIRRIDPELWYARGALNAICVPILALAVQRNPNWQFDLFLSRDMIFRSAVLAGLGAYLLVMGGVAYLLKYHSGSWGNATQAVFLVAAFAGLMCLVLSARWRGYAKVMIYKHFYKSQYDYRQEWLHFTRLLSNIPQGSDIGQAVVRGIAEIVHSTGGALWLTDEHGCYEPAGQWNYPVPADAIVRPDTPLIAFVRSQGWVIDIPEALEKPKRYAGLQLPVALAELPNAGLLVPLFQGQELLGFVVTTRSFLHRSLNWEDCDLLKTVGRQAASYLALSQANDKLTRARQFEAFNRLSAFVVHDLKNLTAQLSLVMTNAERYKNDPAFVSDAFSTVGNSVAKMNRMLGNLRKGEPQNLKTINASLMVVEEAVREAIGTRAGFKPVPECQGLDGVTTIWANRDRFVAVIGSLLHNAQDATPADGQIRIRLHHSGGQVELSVIDSGCGMDEAFVKQQLFVPFVSTKGNAGMGIGAFESREFIHALGGEIRVRSQPGRGTTMTLVLPIAQQISSLVA
jgi:putative PEP-CTERM system histidine kinase